ncbi:MAG: hypothetical protein CVU90_08920 [Firmicutes bacterium HGW-Firmicutes-15]|nr:MAG: hypothetical protein CVU90_08920 [Firmicutes bacterium HGW-Firmicutes-15]
MRLFKKNQPESDQIYVDENKKIRLLRINFGKENIEQFKTGIKDFKNNYKQYLKEFHWRQKPFLFALLGGLAVGITLSFVR